MARTRAREPVIFKVRPATGGLNVSEPPSNIDMREAVDLMNVRFNEGMIQFRNGYGLKYPGGKDNILWIDTVYKGTQTNVVAFSSRKIYYKDSSGNLSPIAAYDGAGSQYSGDYLTMTPGDQYIDVDVGFANYESEGDGSGYFNNGDPFPASNEDSESAELMAFCNGTSDGVFVMGYTASTTAVEAEVISGTGSPAVGKTVAFFAGRLFVGGTQGNPSMLQWSDINNIHRWDPDDYPAAGSLNLGDSPDTIQKMQKLGDYLIVYKSRSIYIGRETFLPDPPVRFSPAPGQGIGLAAPNSVGDLGEEHIFLGWDDVYVFSLSHLKAVGTRIKDELFYGEDGVIPEYLGNCTGVIAEEHDEYWLYVPSGKWPETDAGDPVQNLISNPTFEDGLTNWSAASSDSSHSFTAESAGNIGTQVGRLAVSGTSSWALAASSTHDYGEDISSWEFTVVTFLSVDSDSDVRLQLVFYDDGGTEIETVTGDWKTIASADGLTRILTTLSPTSGTPHQVQAEVYTEATSVNIDIDAVHLLRVDNIESSYIDESSGNKDVSYIDGDNTATPIPFIIDQVGKWIPDTCWVYNYEENAWSKFRIPMTGFGYDSLSGIITVGSLEGPISQQTWRYGQKTTSSFSPTNLIGGVDGQIYEISSLYRDDFEGTAPYRFAGYWESKDFDMDKPSMDKTYARMIVFHAGDHPPTEILAGVSTDSGVAWTERTVTMRQGHTETFVDFFVTGPQARFRVRAETPGYFIEGFAIKAIPRGEVNPY